MAISYNRLWKLLIDKNMKKMDLVENENIGISSSTLVLRRWVGEKLCPWVFWNEYVWS